MNNYERKYINALMKNHYLESESDTKINIKQKGGVLQNEPYGGFPPIYLCDTKEIKEEENTKNREYNKHKNAISIKQIMEQRKNIKPFL
jgi:hypothetical protein